MSQSDFIAALEQELRLRGVEFARAELVAFVDDVWPLAEENPDPVSWAREFIDSGRGSMRA
jgi:hypothetical protein